MLYARMLGGLTLAWDQEPLPVIPSRVARSLLAFLITHRDRAHTRDLLAGTFWPDLPDDTARRRLSQALWQIRRTLQPHLVLHTEADTIRWNPEMEVWVDLAEFERGVASDDLQAVVQAVDLHQGEFLAGYYEDWTLPEQERVRELLGAALLRLVASYKGQAEYERALVYARRLAVQDPWREEAHAEVMRLCHLLDRDAEALKQYEICHEVLQAELGAEPTPATVALAAEIAARSGQAPPPMLPSVAARAIAPGLERPDQLPLVGRQAELAELLRRAEAAGAGRGGMTILYGEAGVGKSRLLRELAANARWRGLGSAWGRCYELAAPPAYQPLVEVLSAGLPTLRGGALEPLWRAELSRLVPDLSSGEDLPPPLSPQEERRRLMEAIARGFLALAVETPFLILLEDAHWMDIASLEALRYLLPRLGDASLLVVVSVRGEELTGPAADLLSAMESTRLAQRMELARLDDRETGVLLQRALELEQPAPRFAARLHSETEGNPYFLIETLWSLLDEGQLYRDDAGLWSTPWDEAAQGYAVLPLPAGVAQSIRRRLERLPAALAAAVDLPAVIGRAIDFPVWLAASGRTEEELLAVGDGLCARKVLVSDAPVGATRADYAFAHDQIRRVAYERMTAPRRRFHHRRVAEALASLAPDEPEALAYHWTKAGVWNQALTYHEQAGARAQAVYANAKAVGHYSQALESLHHLPGPADKVREVKLRQARERIYHLQGDREAQTQDLTALQALAEELDDGRLRAEAALSWSKYWNATGDFSSAIASAKEAVDQAVPLGEPELEAQGRIQWALPLMGQGSYEAARDQLRQALALGQTAGLRQVEAAALRSAGIVAWYLGDLEGAQACFEQGLDICREIGDRATEGHLINNLGLIAVNQGDYPRAKAHFERQLRAAREMGDRMGESRVLGNLGSVVADLGDPRAAIEHHRAALLLCRSIGNRPTEAVQLGNLSSLWHFLGDQEAARDYGQQVLRLGQELGDRLAQAYGWTYVAQALLELGQAGDAADAYKEALAIRRELGQTAMALEAVAGLAHVALVSGDLDQARMHVEEILPHLESGALPGADEPLRVSLICYRVLAALQDRRAERVLADAHSLLQEQAARIDDAELRRSFLENRPTRRAIVDAYQEQQASQAQRLRATAGGRTLAVSLPRTSAPLGRPLRDDEFTTVQWTVAAPEDEAIAGKVARRHHCLLRLLEEAQAQGAAPSHQHLADALGVTRRTVERDMVLLRQSHPHLPPTRGKLSE